jgi:hypothetical protein
MTNKTASVAIKAAASNLALVAPAAFKEGVARSVVIETVRAAIGNSRSEKRFAEVRARFIIGRMAARIQSNAADTLRIAAAEVAFNSAGATGTAKLAKGKRRRTTEEQAAYDAARVAWSGILKDGGIKSLDKRGGGSASHKNKRGATGKRTKKPGNDNAKPVAPNLIEPSKIAAFLDQQAAMLLAFNNKNAGKMTLAERNAIEAFHASIKAAHNKGE